MHDEVSACVDDLPGLNTGIGIDELLMRAEAIAPAVTDHDGSTALTGKQLAADFGKAPSAAIKLEVEYDHWRIESALPDGKHEYLYATTQHSLESLGVSNQLKFYFDITPGLNIQLVIVFLDAQRQKSVMRSSTQTATKRLISRWAQLSSVSGYAFMRGQR